MPKKKGVASVRPSGELHEAASREDFRYVVSIKDEVGEFSRFIASWREQSKNGVSLTENIRDAVLFNWQRADTVATQVSTHGHVARVEHVSDDYMVRTVS